MSVTRIYLVLCALTIATAVAVAVGAPAPNFPAPRDALEATWGTVAELFAHNLLVAIWPLGLLAIGWATTSGLRRIGDGLIAAQLLAHAALIGAAAGTHPDLWRYLPHLPLEWLALTIPAATWAHTRQHNRDSQQVRRATVATVALVALAAVIETYAVPL